ncbi:MAG: M1 family metallopeptidase [Candidatus Marinimicrobia bacterium]|nr:M1 family metallopeptidase [Candidatus Neomarinimicrobiota bacterium]MBT3840301.1 M1 family metallopeptidase [Candidatus Neomarinimicrobiota bacterium]MBT4000299.1 M1 family metallopeptidase [Candidatus Neomarinimicrobiota bacterium]MBT4382611.1 M1 family metallopeptidase [Candidatus Neomarinimicrobiota bacterium]MBT4578506.1 M1 family metallopeptidase [Candidatus Neomarinimicrobiota bacterium]
MKNYRPIFLLLIVSIGFSLDVYSGGKLSTNQAAMDVTHYDIHLKVDPYKKTISGKVIISFILISKPKKIEIDLLDVYHVSGTAINGMGLSFKHNHNKILIENPNLGLFKTHQLEIKYGGKPPEAKKPPWDGGFTWEKSDDGYPWVAVSCQSNGAHIWYPCKEHPSDKVDGVDITITVPDPIMVVANGVLQSMSPEGDRWTTWRWKTEYPMSAYNVNFTAGNFLTVEKTGYILDKPLNMVFYVLPESRVGADELLNEAEEYLNFYASHFGQYPWMKEKFGLVHSPYWGMEHQTINAYGNNYKKTKLGYDFLLFHEMGHEWWGNYLSVADWADFWIHEGFDTYAEALYIEEKFGKDPSKTFVKNRYKKQISNKQAIVTEQNVSTDYYLDNDVYYKGAYTLHSLRYLIGDDIMFASLKEFISMSKDKSHNQTSTAEFISLIHKNYGKNIQWFFDCYLYRGELPTLMVEEETIGDKKYYDLWWKDDGFLMPLEIEYVSFDGKRNRKLDLTNSPLRIVIPKYSDLKTDPNEWLLFNRKDSEK